MTGYILLIKQALLSYSLTSMTGYILLIKQALLSYLTVYITDKTSITLLPDGIYY